MSVCLVCETSLPVSSRFCPSCGTPVPGQTPTIGVPDPGNELFERIKRILTGRFEIRGELGRGGMAAVLLARQVSLDRELAIKVLNPGLNHDADLVQRFLREARTQGRLDHPGIIPVYEVYQEGGLNFYTMPRIQGPSLRLFLKRTPRPPIDQVRRFLRESAEALGYAHRQGLIHRDVKPENMLLDEQKDRLILTDFGIAKTLSSVTMLTMTGEQLGTPRYMSPDQGDSKRPLDGRSDQYSLGLVGYEMLAGHMAFQADNLAELMYKHRYEEPEPLSVLRPDAPEGLTAAVMRAIRKNRDERFDTMEDFVRALLLDEAPAGATLPIADETSVISSSPAVRSTPPPPAAPVITGPAEPPAVAAPISASAITSAPLPPVASPSRKKLPVWVPLALVGLLLGAGVILLQQLRPAGPPDSAEVDLEVPIPPPGGDAPPVPTPLGDSETPGIDPPASTLGDAGAVETEAWLRAQAGFHQFQREMTFDVDSLLAAALGGRLGTLESIEARADSMADAGRFVDATRVLAEAQGAMSRAARQFQRSRGAAAAAQAEARRGRGRALEAGAQEQRPTELDQADAVRARAEALLDGGQLVEAEKAFREAAARYQGLAAALKSARPGTSAQDGAPPGAAPPGTSPPGAAPPAAGGDAEVSAAITRDLARFGQALAREDLGHLRSEFPRLALGDGEARLLTAIFERADQLAVATKRSSVTMAGANATADAEYELNFVQSRTREAGRQSVKLRLQFSQGETGWDLVRIQRR